MTYDSIRHNAAARVYITQADASLAALGYTEHSFPHVERVADCAGSILKSLGYSARDVELVRIAGFLHDVGNMVNRSKHCQSGALIAFTLLSELGFPPEEIAAVTTAIGNHDEGTGTPVSPIAAALILADKSDVRRSRVRNSDVTFFDIHDRVNYSVLKSELTINDAQTVIELALTLDTAISSVMDYFEIFLERMMLCRKAAERLSLRFKFTVNGQQLL